MKTFAILSVLLATALAAGPPAPGGRGGPSGKGKGKGMTTPPGPSPPPPPPPPQPRCPSNAAQPDGKLPQGAISTSALVPISASSPNTAYPSVEWAVVTPNDFCTIFNLRLDSDATQGKICNLVFDFPDTDSGLYSFYGNGHFTFTGYGINAGAVPGTTTYNQQPASGPSPPNPPPTLTPGNSYVVNALPCGIPPGIGMVTVSGALCSTDSVLSFKQQSGGECPMGFYVILTDDPNAQTSSAQQSSARNSSAAQNFS
ncbi:GPI anchored cell wall [Pyrenophora seminiperda CCB06]|uniref:GPI anchored cell wall n=1 Tax=Pyrenophora seminiperda CCB06 TaxID=1302712 RepID=A0A3M7M5U4_9PLEO|nr:GPI anchored cell wall [Pyrenophora seminiperda CCB06]